MDNNDNHAFYPDPRPPFVNYNRTFDFSPYDESSRPDSGNNKDCDSSALVQKPTLHSEICPKKSSGGDQYDWTNLVSHDKTEDPKNDRMTTNPKYNESLQKIQKDGFLSSSMDSAGEEKEAFEDTPYKSETSQQESEMSDGSKTKRSKGEENSKNQQMDYEDQAKLYWSEEKDKLLLSISARFEYDWKKIAKQFGHKKITATFVKTRYHKLTDSQQQSRVKFHPMEDIMLAKYFEKYGFNWTKIAQHFPNRTPSMLKNRYYSFIRKNELLENLLQKAREIDQTQPSINKKENEELKTHMDFSSQNRVPDISQNTLSQNSVSGFSPGETQEMEKTQNNSGRDELSSLREEVNHLKQLFFQTKSELDDLKTNL